MKNEIKKKLKRNLPLIVATLITAFLIFGCWCLGRYLGKKEENIVSASAEEMTGVDNVYPSQNVLPAPYNANVENKNLVQDGISYTFYQDGSFRALGTNSKNSASVLYIYNGPYIDFIGKTTVLSGLEINDDSCSLNVQYFKSGSYLYGQTVNRQNKKSVRSNIVEYDNFLLYFAVSAGSSVDIVVKPCMNVGSTSYPFSPSVYRLEQYYFDKGFTSGNESAKYGVFVDCTVRYSYNESGVAKTYKPLTYYVDNGISLMNHAAYFSGKSNLTDIRLSVDFANPILASELTMIAGGDSALLSTNTFTLTAKNLETGKIVYLTAKFIYVDTLSSFGLSVETGSENRYNYLVYGFYGFNIPNVDSLKTLVFVDNDGKYMNGYNAGYNDGVKVGTKDGYNVGYTAGEEYGKEKGYAEGYAKGENTGTVFGNLLFSIMDAPFRIFRETLNFEILGINFADLVAFILTGALVVFVYKKIKGD